MRHLTNQSTADLLAQTFNAAKVLRHRQRAMKADHNFSLAYKLKDQYALIDRLLAELATREVASAELSAIQALRTTQLTHQARYQADPKEVRETPGSTYQRIREELAIAELHADTQLGLI